VWVTTVLAYVDKYEEDIPTCARSNEQPQFPSLTIEFIDKLTRGQ